MHIFIVKQIESITIHIQAYFLHYISLIYTIKLNVNNLIELMCIGFYFILMLNK